MQAQGVGGAVQARTIRIAVRARGMGLAFSFAAVWLSLAKGVFFRHHEEKGQAALYMRMRVKLLCSGAVAQAVRPTAI